jgi:O-acetyl-ADP-ribose deacetylase (regulator of RNase III)
MKTSIEGKTLELVQGDITDQDTDAIANAANSGLHGGGGVDGAIHRAGGPGIMKECRKIGGCPTGSAVITTAGQLKATHVIHAVGPIWRGGDSGEPELLESAYRSCLDIAHRHGLKSISFPSISTGVYGYPVAEAANVALSAVIEHLKGKSSLAKVVFVLFDRGTFDVYAHALERLT